VWVSEGYGEDRNSKDLECKKDLTPSLGIWDEESQKGHLLVHVVDGENKGRRGKVKTFIAKQRGELNRE